MMCWMEGSIDARSTTPRVAMGAASSFALELTHGQHRRSPVLGRFPGPLRGGLSYALSP